MKTKTKRGGAATQTKTQTIVLVTCTLSLVTCLVACNPQNTPSWGGGQGEAPDSQILAPFVEPTLNWGCTYKELMNTMLQKGFSTSRATETTVYYDYFAGSSLRQTAIAYLDSARCYHAAEITIHDITVSQQDIKKYLAQQYITTGTTQYPTPEIFYQSKVATDSILVSYRMENGYPTITYTKGMN